MSLMPAPDDPFVSELLKERAELQTKFAELEREVSTLRTERDEARKKYQALKDLVDGALAP